MRAELRNASRREVTLPCQVVREHDFVLVADRILDLSIDGMMIPLKRSVLTGEQIILSFSIPGMWIDAEATVARIIHNRRPGDDGLAAGLVFHTLAPAARAALAGYLHGKNETLPRRGPLAALRRGAAPKLADEVTMSIPTDSIEAVGILRAVVAAWQQLGV